MKVLLAVLTNHITFSEKGDMDIEIPRELGERDSVVLDLQRRLISLSQTIMSLEQKLEGEGGRGSARGEGGGDGEARADRLQFKLDRLVHAMKALKAESQDALVTHTRTHAHTHTYTHTPQSA